MVVSIIFVTRSKLDQKLYAIKRVEVLEDNGTSQLKEVQHAKELVHENLVRVYHFWIEEVCNRHEIKKRPEIQMDVTFVHSNGVLRRKLFENFYERRKTPISASWSSVSNNSRKSMWLSVSALKIFHSPRYQTSLPRTLKHALRQENIVLTLSAFTPKIADFGQITQSTPWSKSMTKGVGTEHYMAPEIFADDYTMKVDIYR